MYAGRIEFTPNIFDQLGTEDGIGVWHRIAIHEFSHLLGMSSDSFPYWYDSVTGFPRTPRPFNYNLDCGTVASETTVRLSADVTHSGLHYEIITPTVKAVVQNQFNCSGDIGGRLETYPGGCFGDHWDAVRYFARYLSRMCLNLSSLTDSLISYSYFSVGSQPTS